MQELSHQSHRFDGFTLDLTRGCLLRGTHEIKLRPKPFEALKYLVENAGRLISKAELIENIWPDTAVTDDSLVQCLIEVRRALGDDTQRIIKTVPRRGYIFEKQVESGPTAALTTYKEETTGVQVIIEEEETNGLAVIETSPLPAAGSVALLPEHKATSVERLKTAIKQHRLMVALAVLTLTVAVAAVIYFTRPSESIDSIAVMPFVNVSGDPNMEYLSEGLSDNIIDSLSQLPSLKTVIARSSVSRYKGKRTDPQEIGRKLNVRAVLIGQVIKRGDDLSISVELVDVRDNKHLWGAQYNRRLADIISVQTDIAQEISERLRLRLSGEEKKRLAKRYTDNVEAYQLYLMGCYYSNRWTKEGLEKSIEFYEQAIKKDPNYAPAYAELAFTYGTLGILGVSAPKEGQQRQEWAALKALAIDNDLAEAHSAMAFVRAEDLNWLAAEEEHKRALELNPNSALVHVNYAYYLEPCGRLDEAMLHVRRAQELDPLNLDISAEVGTVFYYSRQYDRAIEQLQKITEMDPNFAMGHGRLAWTYQAKGMSEEAITECKKALALDNRSRKVAQLGYAYAVAGKRDEALKILDDLNKELPKQGYVELSKHGYVSPFDFALIHMGLGDKEQAFAYLEKAYQERPDTLNYIKVDPKFDSLRADPRFEDLLRRMKLAP